MIELNTLHKGLTYVQYDLEPGVRSSDLQKIRQSPAHMKHAKANQKPASDALLMGQAIHSALDNGEKFLANYIVEPNFDRRTKVGKEDYAKFWAEVKPADIVVKEEWVDTIKGVLNSMRSHKLVKNIIKNGTREGSLWVKDPETGLTLKCKPDLITDQGHLVDYKSTRNAHPDSFLSDIFSKRGYFYILQMAHYVHCLKVAGLGSGDSAIIIAVEKEAPYGVMVYPLDIGCLAVGEQWRDHLTKLYAECEAKNEWRCYPEEAVPVVPPEWASVPDSEV